VWALAILTACAIFGDHSAFAMNGPRVKAEGWFSRTDQFNTQGNGSDKVNFGLTGRCDKNGWTSTGTGAQCNVGPDGHFEYHNHFTGLKAHGKILTLIFEPTPANSSCVMAPGGDPTLAGKPSANVTGNCDDGSCSFKMRVIDADDDASGSPDWVCDVNVMDNNHTPDGPAGKQ
jgi:hypothetical protein